MRAVRYPCYLCKSCARASIHSPRSAKALLKTTKDSLNNVQRYGCQKLNLVDSVTTQRARQPT